MTLQTTTIHKPHCKKVMKTLNTLDLVNTLAINLKTAVIPAMADTGCQGCLPGVKVIHRLGLQKHHLIPVKIKMHAAN